MSLSLKGRLNFLFGHPEFQRRPFTVSSRILSWMIFKKLGYAPEIRIHEHSRMRLQPEPHGMGAPGLIYLFREQYESSIPYCIRRFVKEGDSCFDIGANVGVWSLLMSELSGSSGHVYSFEPLPRNLDRFRQNIQLSERTNITVMPTALGKETGRVKIYTPEDPGRTSLAPESANDKVEEVPLRRLDDVWAELNFPRITFAKMDVEGSEPFVLEGGCKFFSECKPVVVSEINGHKLTNLGRKPEDTFAQFRELDYEAYELNDRETGLNRIPESKEGDVVFLHRQCSV